MDATFVRGNLWDKIQKWVSTHPKSTLALAVFIALGSFLAKPFNMDDPLFVWTARQIQAHPFNPYGFLVNWYGTESPMWNVTQNPPLASYYLALAATVLGWNEIALHTALLLPALAVILGTYRLARRFCDQPLLAALATLFTPVFLVSSTSVMCDVLMLAFWIWAMVLWVEGIERESFWPMAGAGLLIALAALTKYFGVCLIPLLAVYSVMGKRRIGRCAACLLIPVLALCAWQWASHALYQHDPLVKAADYASRMNGFFAGTKAAAGLTALSFTGGCLASAVFLAPLLWRGRILLGLIGGGVLLAFALFYEGTLLHNFNWIQGWACLSMEAQTIFWTIGGISVLTLALADVWNHRDARSWLLALWVFGTFAFAAAFNWTINGRSILPMAPAVGILLARRLQQRAGTNENDSATHRRRIIIPLAASALIAFLVAQADFLLAAAVRQTAIQVCERYGRSGRTLWFQGHWGFQYYMTALGAQMLDIDQSAPRPDDFLAVPVNNTNVRYASHPLEELHADGPRFLSVMNIYLGAAFYSSTGGPLPFAFGPVPSEYVMVSTWKSGLRARP